MYAANMILNDQFTFTETTKPDETFLSFLIIGIKNIIGGTTLKFHFVNSLIFFRDSFTSYKYIPTCK